MQRTRMQSTIHRNLLFHLLLLFFFSTVLPLFPLHAQPLRQNMDELSTFESDHYRIHTTVPREEARFYARHMDTVFEEYTERFQALTGQEKIHENMDLYLFRTQDEYSRYMEKFGIKAALTGGMYFQQGNYKGLATFTRRKIRSISETFSTLQHEGFHQFAAAYIGIDLPIWANEGIAQYFEDGIVIEGERMRLGILNKRRIRRVKQALQEGTILPFSNLLNMSPQRWQREIMTDRSKAQVAYAQSWAMVYFLINAEQRYRKAFVKYLQLIRDGSSSRDAFEETFKTDNPKAFRKAWEKYARKMSPGPVAVTEARLNFLGRALHFFNKEGKEIPDDVDELRRILQRARFRATFVTNKIRTTYNAQNDKNFEYPMPDGDSRQFEMLAPEKEKLPPRITAKDLSPRPTLAWYENANGKIMYDIIWEE